ncbi:MAG: hypothetical protein QOH35_1555, partial [Acidobacteriaceae bacterium]|nr:hypothetical protein [Acidobacteriaceae bacterium]
TWSLANQPSGVMIWLEIFKIVEALFRSQITRMGNLFWSILLFA